MSHGKQTKIAREAGISQPLLSKVVNGKRRVGWENAKRLARITGTDPAIWMDGDLVKIREAMENYTEQPAA